MKAQVKIPGGISKEFDLGVNTLEDQVEIELPKRTSLCIKKRDLLVALDIPESIIEQTETKEK